MSITHRQFSSWIDPFSRECVWDEWVAWSVGRWAGGGGRVGRAGGRAGGQAGGRAGGSGGWLTWVTWVGAGVVAGWLGICMCLSI